MKHFKTNLLSTLDHLQETDLSKGHILPTFSYKKKKCGLFFISQRHITWQIITYC